MNNKELKYPFSIAIENENHFNDVADRLKALGYVFSWEDGYKIGLKQMTEYLEVCTRANNVLATHGVIGLLWSHKCFFRIYLRMYQNFDHAFHYPFIESASCWIIDVNKDNLNF